MTAPDEALFSAAHGFYNFAITDATRNRSLVYNLLLQPAIALPEHYFLQGSWLTKHFDRAPSRDSWVEVGLRNGFVVPYLRREDSTFAELLSTMQASDRRGFGPHANSVAERLDRTPFTPRQWSSPTNSEAFGTVLSDYMRVDKPPCSMRKRIPTTSVDFGAGVATGSTRSCTKQENGRTTSSGRTECC